MATTVSIVSEKGGHLKHNNRENISENVIVERIEDNITLIQKDLIDFYEEIFGAAIAESDKNKRKREQIGSSQAYMEKIKHSKNGESLFHEKVVMVGKKEDIEANPALKEVYKEILLEYFKEFQKNNPNLKVFNAVLHMDEATPHLHIDYVPVGTEFKKGLQVRNSRSKAYCELTNQKDSSLALKTWFKAERELLRGICERFGVETKQIKQDNEQNRPKLSTREYRAEADQQALALEREYRKRKKENEQLQKDYEQLLEKIENEQFLFEQLKKYNQNQLERNSKIPKALENQKILDNRDIDDLEKFIAEYHQMKGALSVYQADNDLFDFCDVTEHDIQKSNQTNKTR